MKRTAGEKKEEKKIAFEKRRRRAFYTEIIF
jgi:hypothetical protein